MERWLAVPGYEGRYEVSDLGRVRSLQRKGAPRASPLVLHDYVAGRGYRFVGLFDGKKYRPWYVHRLVLTAFVGPPPEGMEGAHLDGVNTHNALLNLQWVTRTVNMSHKVLHGTAPRGEAVYNHKLTEAQVLEARARWIPGSREASCHVLATEYGVTQSHMSDVLAGRRWGHVGAARPPAVEHQRNPFSHAGADNPRAILKAADVMAIRAEVASVGPGPRLFQRLSDTYGVCRKQIQGAAYGRSWKHLPGAVARVAA